MNKLAILAILIAVLLVSGCVLPAKESGNETDNNTTTKKTTTKAKISEAKALEIANQSELAELFYGIYPTVERTINQEDCCTLSIVSAGNCGTCTDTRNVWFIKYTSGTAKAVLALDSNTGDEAAIYPALDYLKSGKYCMKDSDCMNIGSYYSALCINKYYTGMLQETPCNPESAGCVDIECCKCSNNVCVKKTELKPASCVPTDDTGSTIPGVTGTSKECSSIDELTAGQTVASSNRTLVFGGVYESGSIYSAKFTVTSSDGIADTRYIESGTANYVGGVYISLTDVSVPVGGGSALASISISGMGTTCTISS